MYKAMQNGHCHVSISHSDSWISADEMLSLSIFLFSLQTPFWEFTSFELCLLQSFQLSASFPTMAAEMALVKPMSKFTNLSPKFSNPKGGFGFSYSKFSTIRMSATSQSTTKKPSKKAAKTAIKETLLTPRFYTTDFDEMEQLFNTEINKNLNQDEFEALLQEFKTDYNQTHFVRNKEFKEAADKLQGPLRQIFVEFLERSCTAEFSGFLLYKELGRRLKVFFLFPLFILI